MLGAQWWCSRLRWFVLVACPNVLENRGDDVGVLDACVPPLAAPGAPSAGARCPSRPPGTAEPPPCRAGGSRSAPASPARSRTPRPGPSIESPPPRCLPRRREAARWCVAAASECPRSSPNDASNTRFTLTSRWTVRSIYSIEAGA